MSVDISNLWKYDLRKGNTDHPANGACLFDAGMWLVYGRIGDDPPCSCPIIRRYAIGLNDHMPYDQRQRLKPFILRVVGNRDPDAEAARLRVIVLETARRIIPLIFDASYPELAAEMRALSDEVSYPAIRGLVRRASCVYAAGTATYANAYAIYAAFANAAANAAYAAATYANAADAAADAAAAAAYAAAFAAAYAAYAANACAYATAWDIAITILDTALQIGRQAPEFDEDEVKLSVEIFERARERV